MKHKHVFDDSEAWHEVADAYLTTPRKRSKRQYDLTDSLGLCGALFVLASEDAKYRVTSRGVKRRISQALGYPWDGIYLWPVKHIPESVFQFQSYRGFLARRIARMIEAENAKQQTKRTV